MSQRPLTPGRAKQLRIADLIQTLREAGRELQELTDEDPQAAPALAEGRPALLDEAREELRRTAAVQRQLIKTHEGEQERKELVLTLGERVKELRTLYEVTRLLAEGGGSQPELLRGVAESLRGAMQFPQMAAVQVRHGPMDGNTADFRESEWRLEGSFRTNHGTEGHVVIVYLERPPVGDKTVFSEEERCLVDTVAGLLRAHFERRRVDESLRHSEASMSVAQKIAHFGSWELSLGNTADINANALRWSDEMFRIVGYEPGAVEVTNELFFSLVPAEDHAMIQEAVACAIRDHSQYEVVHRMVRPDGEVRIVNEMAELFFDETTGQLVKMIGTARDITDQRRAEEALRKSGQEQRELVRRLEAEQARLAVAQQVGKVGNWETDLGTQEMSWSAETHRIFETSPTTFEPTLQRVLELVHPADREMVHRAFTQSLRHEEARALEHRLLMADGRVKHVEERWQTFFDENGTPMRAVGTCQDITERCEVSEEIERTASLLRAVADGTPDAIFVKDLQGRYQFFNEGAAQLVGRSVQEVLGRDDTELFPPEEARIVMENDQRAMASGEALTQEEELTADGTRRIYLATKAPYCDSSGKVIGLIGISRDITERKQHERRLAVLSTLGRELNTATTPRHAAEIIVAAADELLGWDAASLDLYAAEADQITSVLSKDTIDGQKQDCEPAYHLEPPSSLARATIQEGPSLILRAADAESTPSGRMFGDTQRRSASLMFVPISDSKQVIGVLSIQSYRVNAYGAEDLKVLELLADYCDGALNRIQTESLRQVSEERFREMAENIGDIFYSYDPANNRLLYANQAFERLWGRPLETVYENALLYLEDVYEDDRFAVEGALQQQLEGQKTEVEFRIVRADGTLCWVRKLDVPIFDEEKRVKRIVGIMRDVTERRVIADRMTEQAALLDKAQDAILVRDLDHRVLFWNKSAERLYGWTAEEALGRHISDLLYKDAGHLHSATESTLTHGEWSGELPKYTKTGRQVTIQCHWSLVRDERGQPKSILMIDTDVTERKAIEQQYLRAQRMESIGTLAGGIAHDLNNVLAPILMSIELLRLQEQNPRRLAVLTTIEQSAKRGADMVKQVLSFARGVEGEQLDVDISHLIYELEKITNETFLKNIQVRAEIADAPWIVRGDPTQLHQVLLNLCVNARDAMPNGGSLLLSTSNLMLDSQYAGMNIEARPGPYVRIGVEDTGSGMPPEVVERIFEPFFTTKELGKGTGLGLSTTLAIVKSHGGFVRVYSEPGNGTRFHIYLPAHAMASSEIEQSAPELPRGQDQLVLVVDDEASVRMITQQTLEAFGYRVLLAADGADAISKYALGMKDIDVVLTDMMMPLMDGPATIQVLFRLNPNVRIIAASGLNANGMVTKALHAGVKHFIPKPYTAETLLKTLQQVLVEG